MPAQFFEMTDEEKLASPSFEEMDAGLVFGSNAWTFDEPQTVAAPLIYESFVIDDVAQPSKLDGRLRVERTDTRAPVPLRFGGASADPHAGPGALPRPEGAQSGHAPLGALGRSRR